MEQVFFDGVDSIKFCAGLVRINTFTLLSTEEDSAPESTVAGPCLVTTPQGFAAMLYGFENMAEKLTENGVMQQVMSKGSQTNIQEGA